MAQVRGQLPEHCVQGTLRVVAHKARKLAKVQLIGTQDPYVKFTCGDHTHKSKPHDNGGSDPDWNNASNVFDVVLEGKENTLQIEVFNSNVVSDNIIGRVNPINIDDVLKMAGAQGQWFRLGRGNHDKDDAGEILLSVQYIPPLVLTIDEAKDLVDTELVGKQDPYVEFTLGKAKFKTPIVNDAGANAKWNKDNTFRFNLKDRDLNNDEIQVVVRNQNVLKDALIGKTSIKLGDLTYPERKKWYSISDETGKKSGEIHIISVYK